MFYGHPDDDSRLATEAEADAEYARIVGAERPEQAWILSDRDVWYRNPAYSGPPVPHPEEECYGEPRGDEIEAQIEAMITATCDRCSGTCTARFADAGVPCGCKGGQVKFPVSQSFEAQCPAEFREPAAPRAPIAPRVTMDGIGQDDDDFIPF